MIKKGIYFIVFLMLLGGGYFLTLMYSTGFFRSIENRPYGVPVREIPLPGAEDLTIDYASGRMFISSFDRAAGFRGEQPTGGIYVLDLTKPDAKPIRLSWKTFLSARHSFTEN